MTPASFLRRALPRRQPRVFITLDCFHPNGNRAVVLIVPMAMKAANRNRGVP